MPKRFPLLVLLALAPLPWFVLEGGFLTLRYGTTLSRYGAEGLTTAVAAISLMRDAAARHAGWAACVALAVWRSLPKPAPASPPTGAMWVGWIATWLWVPLTACAGVLIATAVSLAFSPMLFHAELGLLARKVTELSRLQDAALLLIRSSVFGAVVSTGAHAWRQRLGPAPGAPRWNVTLWRAGGTCAALTLLDVLPWWLVVGDDAPSTGLPLDPMLLP